MEINKAIEWQNAFKRTYKGNPMEKEVCEACDMAIKTLENQIMKKPRKREIGGEALKRIIYHCPNCDKRLYDCAVKNGELDHVSPGSRKSKRCEKCDCRLDWSDFNG